MFMSGCECVSVWVCPGVCMCYSYVRTCVFMSLSQATNAALCVSGCEFVVVY